MAGRCSSTSRKVGSSFVMWFVFLLLYLYFFWGVRGEDKYYRSKHPPPSLFFTPAFIAKHNIWYGTSICSVWVTCPDMFLPDSCAPTACQASMKSRRVLVSAMTKNIDTHLLSMITDDTTVIINTIFIKIHNTALCQPL